jgi:hypothetical protein
MKFGGNALKVLGSGFRRNLEKRPFAAFYETLKVKFMALTRSC